MELSLRPFSQCIASGPQSKYLEFVLEVNCKCKYLHWQGPGEVASWNWKYISKKVAKLWVLIYFFVMVCLFPSNQDLSYKKWRKAAFSRTSDSPGISWEALSYRRLQVWFKSIHSGNFLWSIKNIFISWWTSENGYREVSYSQWLKFGKWMSGSKCRIALHWIS